MREPRLEISVVSVEVPVERPRRRGRHTADQDDARIQLEMYATSCRVWDSAGYTLCGANYSYDLPADTRLRGEGRDKLIAIPYFDEVYRFLVTWHAANRTNPLGKFVAPALAAMDTAIAERDGAQVYFARAGDRIKIGWSRKVSARIAQLQTGNPEPVTLLATTPGGRAVERQIHERFADTRVSGEWFHATNDLLAFISELSPATVIPFPTTA